MDSKKSLLRRSPAFSQISYVSYCFCSQTESVFLPCPAQSSWQLAKSEDGVVFLKPLMDGVGRDNAESLLLTVAGIEHLEAAGLLQGGAMKGC